MSNVLLKEPTCFHLFATIPRSFVTKPLKFAQTGTSKQRLTANSLIA